MPANARRSQPEAVEPSRAGPARGRPYSRVDDVAQGGRHNALPLRAMPTAPSATLERVKPLPPGGRLSTRHPLPAVRTGESGVQGEVGSTRREVRPSWYRTPEEREADIRMVCAIREMLSLGPLYGHGNGHGEDVTVAEQHALPEYSYSHGYEGNLRKGYR
jgi:hypothetical protein